MEKDNQSLVAPAQDRAPFPYRAPANRDNDESDIVVADFWRRTAASLLDQAIAAYPAWLITERLVGTDSSAPTLVAIIVFLILSHLLACLLGVVLGGTTAGKRLLGLKVVAAATLGPISRRQYLVRMVVEIISISISGIGSITMLMDPRGRALHDGVSDMLVIRR